MMLKKSIGICVGLMMIIVGSVAGAAPEHPSNTKEIRGRFSGSFVSTNFDFDHPDLSTPANYLNYEGVANFVGKTTSQGVNEFAPDGKTCTVPGGTTGAATEFALVVDLTVSRSKATGDLLFFKGT